MTSIWNVLSKTKEYAPVVTQEELDRAGQGKPLQDVLAANALNDARREDAGWRDELEELTRRLTGLPSVEEAEARLSNLEASFAGQAKELGAKSKQAGELLRTPFLSRLDETQIRARLAKLDSQASDLRASSRFVLAQARALVETAREWEPKRGRWQELKERAKKIDAALAAA